MEKEEFSCNVCDTEFSVEHYGDSVVSFCPFCGDDRLFDEDEDLDESDWGHDDE